MICRRLWLIVAVALVGCGDPIGSAINAKFPPIDESTQRQTAVDTTAQALSSLTSPNVAIALNIKHVEQAAFTDDQRKQGVTALELRGDNQLVRARIKFKRKFDAADGGDNEDARKWLMRLQPEIGGTIEAYIGITGALANQDPSKPELQLRLLPGLSRVEVERITLAEKIDATKVAELLVGVLNRYKDNVSGELSRNPFTTMTIPAAATNPIDLSTTFNIRSPETDFAVHVQAAPITAPVKLDGIAWLVTDDRIAALIQFSKVDTKGGQTVEVENTYNAIRQQFRSLLSSAFDAPEGEDVTWAAVRKELIAVSLNSVVAQASACVSVVGNTHQQSKSTVPMPSGDGVDCSSNRNCEPSRVCAFSANKDERDCSACILSRPVICAPRVCAFGGCVGGGCTGGGCIQHGNDLTCEVAKAAQNAIYLADANKKKAECDVVREAERVGCQAEELGKKALCESGKATLNAIKRTGNFANIDVDATLHSDNLRICLRDVNMAPGLDRVALALDVSGHAKADVDVKFTPLDIVGHLACQFPWKEKQTFTAEVRDSRIGFASAMTLVADGKQPPRLDFAVEPQTVKARLSPGPAEFLVKSPNMTIACSGLNFIKPLVVVLSPFVKELRGEIDQNIDRIDASLRLPVPTVSIGGKNVEVAFDQTPQAILLRSNFIAAGNWQ